MVTTMNIVLIFSWLPQAVYQALVWTYWWQDKEYRVDRFRVFFFSNEGRRRLSLFLITLKFLSIFYFILSGSPSPTLIVFFISDIYFLNKYLREGLRRPTFTQRAVKIFATSIFFIFLAIIGIVLFPYSTPIFILLGELSLVFSYHLGTIWTSRVVNRVREKETLEARKVLSKVKPTVIGVTGSYGKSTTKDFIAQLLSQKYKTVKTPGSENTHFGVVRAVNGLVKESTEFFVVEMGAYTTGEIKNLSEIVSPNVGVVTGLEVQHLSLFKTFENIKEAKFELIESLPEGGIAIFNLSNDYCKELFDKAKVLSKKLKIYGYAVNESHSADIVSTPILVDENGVSFWIVFQNEKKKLFAPIAGLHLLENLTAAILIARLYKIPWSSIKKACASIQLPDHTMKTYSLKNDVIIVDDSRNSTPHAFESALSYLTYFNDRLKIVITPGIIELGEKSELIHRKLGKLMSFGVDKVVLTNSDYYSSIKMGLRDGVYKLVTGDQSKLRAEVTKVVNEGNCVILIEGRIPSYLSKILNN